MRRYPAQATRASAEPCRMRLGELPILIPVWTSPHQGPRTLPQAAASERLRPRARDTRSGRFSGARRGRQITLACARRCGSARAGAGQTCCSSWAGVSASRLPCRRRGSHANCDRARCLGSAQKRQSGVWPGGGATGGPLWRKLFDESTRLGGSARSGGGFSTGGFGLECETDARSFWRRPLGEEWRRGAWRREARRQAE
jgi:hypothetical protein